ncbi:LADA_0H12948g1_1 [Lachancea dasiensis]|uniref:LADA_0H12948g1_1 n=1 Tax=Lachancea dasiensis TaxID=1072105 RepID=A0A1G4K483_9SACH|nr:LADA_0H12948g1_1 [Lachancea dasiensis]
MSAFSHFGNGPTLSSVIAATAAPKRHDPSASFSRKRSFDDLLLPSLNFNSPRLCYKEKPYVLQPLLVNQPVSKRARTAPASPVGVNLLTPTTSPLLTKVNIACTSRPGLPSVFSGSLTTDSQDKRNTNPVNEESYVPGPVPATKSSQFNAHGHFSSYTSIPLHQNSGRDESDSDEQPFRSHTSSQCEALPSLRHLQLLPHPKIQEQSYRYPDTSENTPFWRENLLSWCKNENYSDYLTISQEVKNTIQYSQAPRLSTLANVASMLETVPSILKPSNEFYGLSNTAPYQGVVTPPMSPCSPSISVKDSSSFTPIMSDKMIQFVKEKRTKSHKKTNSFKAREMKKLLSNRDLFSPTSKAKVTKVKQRTKSKPSAPPSPQQYIMKISTLASPKSLTKTPGGDNAEEPHVDTAPIRTGTPPKTHVFALNEPQTPTRATDVIPELTSHKSKTTPESPLVGATTTSTRKPSSPKRVSNRTCISCLASDSPCWRPSWTNKKQDQLCNSCGLRYKKTQTRCLNDSCRKIPSKGELAIMKANGMLSTVGSGGETIRALGCLFCNSLVETKEWLEHK